jgi:hypothetical protein
VAVSAQEALQLRQDSPCSLGEVRPARVLLCVELLDHAQRDQQPHRPGVQDVNPRDRIDRQVLEQDVRVEHRRVPDTVARLGDTATQILQQPAEHAGLQFDLRRDQWPRPGRALVQPPDLPVGGALQHRQGLRVGRPVGELHLHGLDPLQVAVVKTRDIRAEAREISGVHQQRAQTSFDARMLGAVLQVEPSRHAPTIRGARIARTPLHASPPGRYGDA